VVAWRRRNLLDKDRAILREGDVATREPSLRKVFGKEHSLQIVIEASNGAFWVATLLSELGHTVHVVDPNRTKAIGSSLIKSDKLDARWLAYLCAAGLLAAVRVPPRAERIAKMPATARDVLVRSRTRLLNAVRGMAASEGIHLPNCAATKLVELVQSVQERFPPGVYDAMRPLLDAIDALSASIDVGTEQLTAKANADPLLLRLQTVPGVGPLTATTYVAAIADPHRFKSGRDVGAYLGLVPSLYQSGATMRRGRITKRGNRQARWALTMAANGVLLLSDPLVLTQRERKRIAVLYDARA
jgi:transposase